MKQFWQDWLKANELEKVKLIEKLNIQNAYIHPRWWDYLLPRRIAAIKSLCSYSIASLINSYLTDLAEELKSSTEV